MSPETSRFARRALVAAAIAVALIAAALLLWIGFPVLLLVFGAVLIGVFLQGVSEVLSRRTRLPYKACLLVVFMLLAGLGVALAWLLGPRIASQLDRLLDVLPDSVAGLRQRLRQYEWGTALLDELTRPAALIPPPQQVVAQVTGLLSMVLDTLAKAALAVFVGVYLAFEPAKYIHAVVLLVPGRQQARAREVLGVLGHALRRWLVGRLASMTVVGVATTIGLWLLGVKLALSLGFLAGVLSFIPNIGPILSVIPALLVASLGGADQVIYVAILYTGIQAVESYVITPMIQVRAVSTPPALTLTAQVLLGVFWGIPGLLLATPLTVVAIILVQMLYIEDVLGQKVKLLGQQ